MSEIDYTEIKKWLEHGEIQEIALKHELSKQHASKIIGGKVKRPKVSFLSELMDRALKNKRLLMSKQDALKAS